MYQETIDNKVVNFCRKLGFNISILKKGCWTELGDNFSVLCHPHHDGDSWLATRCGGHTFLNLNDCVIDSEREVRAVKANVGNVDVLLTQFSYASWFQTPEQRRRAAENVLKRIELQCKILKPAVTIPFASFIRFCHQENQYMNDCANSIRDTYQFISGFCFCVVMYPGDNWDGFTKINSEQALTNYWRDEQAEIRLFDISW